MDNSRKRCRGNELSKGNVPTKKSRRAPCNDIAITNEQQSIINLTANTFQVSPTALLDAINDLKQSSRLWLPETMESKPHSSHYTLENKVLESVQMPPLPHLAELPREEYDMTLVQSQNRQNEAANALNQVSVDASSDTLFGFQFKGPGPWADCFASMFPLDPQVPPLPNSATQDSLIEKPFNSYQAHGQNALNTPKTNTDWCSHFFACDDFDLQWLPPNPSSSFPQFSSLQTIQPSLSRPAMIFPQDNVSINDRVGTDLITWDASEKEEHSRILVDKDYDLVPTEASIGEQIKPSSLDFTEKALKLGQRTFKNAKDRKETAQTRRLTACIRCRMQRIRCTINPTDPHGTCLTCMKVSKMKVPRLPCLRYKITEVQLFVTSMAPGRIWSTRWQDTKLKDIDNWASPEIRTVMMTQDFSPRPMIVKVRRFIPLEPDMLHRSWAHGAVKKSVTLPPYAFANMRASLQTYLDYINQEGSEHFNNILDRDDKLLRETYSAAIKASNSVMAEPDRKLLKMVFRLWVASRMTTKSERLCGGDTLDIPHNLLDESHPMHGQIPITPVMSAQIDVLVKYGIMIPLRNRILEQLSALILANKPKNWFCIYLCIFVLLHDCSLKMARNAIYARKHGMKTQFANMDNISEIHMGANILLAHFHYSCKGYRVFEMDWKAEETMSMSDLNAEQVQFIQKTAAYVQVNKTHFAEILEQRLLEHEHYFIAQLYEADWEPRSAGF